jgi:hypothetical protein
MSAKSTTSTTEADALRRALARFNALRVLRELDRGMSDGPKREEVRGEIERLERMGRR